MDHDEAIESELASVHSARVTNDLPDVEPEPSLSDAESDALTFEGWRSCKICKQSWVPYKLRGKDEALAALCGFDLARALNLLLEATHANHPEPTRYAAAFEAHMRIFHIREGLGHERISETTYLAAISACREALRVLTNVGRKREALEAELEARTHGSRSRPRPLELTRGALRLAGTLDRYLGALELKWSFDSNDRTLPGTHRTRGAPRKTLLREVEQILSHGGFSHPEIALLDLDGSWRPGGSGAAEQRVRDRLRSERRGGKY